MMSAAESKLAFLYVDQYLHGSFYISLHVEQYGSRDKVLGEGSWFDNFILTETAPPPPKKKEENKKTRTLNVNVLENFAYKSGLG